MKGETNKKETNKSEQIPIVAIELVAPAPRRRPIDASEMNERMAGARKVLKKMVEEQVAELMANRDDFIFRPFFDEAKISREIKRLQTVPEQKKWSLFHAQFGCLRCESRTKGHAGCGMCFHCSNLTYHRLQRILKRCEKADRQRPELFSDHDELAALALAPALKELNAGRRPKRRTALAGARPNAR
jgi:hypothetical protein